MKKENKQEDKGLKITYVPIESLRHPEKNPRKWSREARQQLRESIERHGVIDPLVCNNAPGREGVILGGNFRYEILKEMKMKTVPVVNISVPDPDKEAEIILRLNKNVGDWDFDLLASYDESLLTSIGFSSEERDSIFVEDETPETFDLKRELERLDIKKVTVQKGDRYDFGKDIGVVMCGDSTIESDMLKLMDGEKADMVMTDPPYRLQYLDKGKRRDGATVGFGMKKNRRYLETESLPADFTEKWMANISKVAAKDFSIIVYENWKNIREIWGEMEKHWKVRNMIVWHLPNRNQGYAGRNKFFSKHDVAMVGTSKNHGGLNSESEGELLDNEYQTALFAIQGHGAHWEGYKKGRKYCPTDHISFNAADEKSSGQAIVFGVKPTEILIPYIKILSRRAQLLLEPFGGSGSSAASAFMLGRRFRLMEKSPTYAQVILRRLTLLTGVTPKKI
ncbi:MAG: DNA modification methylase [Patescibacteria group bacterium]|nr:DNA modification methylase [Patescibacteria group bacterium]